MTSVFVLMIACFLDVCPASFCSFTIFFQSETHLNLNYLQLYIYIFFTFEQPEVSIFTLFGSNSSLFLHNIWVQSFGIKAQKEDQRIEI